MIRIDLFFAVSYGAQRLSLVEPENVALEDRLESFRHFRLWPALFKAVEQAEGQFERVELADRCDSGVAKSSDDVSSKVNRGGGVPPPENGRES